jgi:hypothetical protein
MLPLLASSECFALRAQHNGKFLQSVIDRHSGPVATRFEASADTVAGNARARFFLEPSEEDEGIVHIRNCYNNKYWFVIDSNDGYISGADGLEEDTSTPSRTSFQPITVAVAGMSNTIQLSLRTMQIHI